MSAIEQCRSAALGGHVLRCDACAQVQIAYNSCRNRHCPKCRRVPRGGGWKRGRPTCCRSTITIWCSRCQHRSRPSPTTTRRGLRPAVRGRRGDTAHIAADPKHLGGAGRVTLVLPYLGLRTDAPPHVHGIVPGGGLAADGKRWVRCRPGSSCRVRVLSRLFPPPLPRRVGRRPPARGRLQFFGSTRG